MESTKSLEPVTKEVLEQIVAVSAGMGGLALVYAAIMAKSVLSNDAGDGTSLLGTEAARLPPTVCRSRARCAPQRAGKRSTSRRACRFLHFLLSSRVACARARRS